MVLIRNCVYAILKIKSNYFHNTEFYVYNQNKYCIHALLCKRATANVLGYEYLYKKNNN